MIFGSDYRYCEIRGAIHNWFYCRCDYYNVIYLNRNGILPSYCNDDKKPYGIIKVNRYDGIYTWTFTTDIPCEPFNIFKDGKEYCLGIVFDINSLDIEA